MIKAALSKFFPSFYPRLRDFRWEAQAWALEHLEEQGPEKKAEWVLAKWAKDVKQIPLDPAKPKILFLAVEGWPYHVLCQVMMALRLRQRGHHVEFVDCERDVPFCNMGNSQTPDPRPCAYCVHKKEAYIKKWFSTQNLGPASEACRQAIKEVESLDISACRQFVWQGLPLGQLCEPTLMWFLCRAYLKDEDVLLFRKLLQGGLLAANRFAAHLTRVKPDCAVIFNGDFFVERIARELCQRNNIRYVTHELGYLPNTLFVAENKPAAGGTVEDTFNSVVPLTSEKKERVQTFFKNRRSGPMGIGGKVFWPSIQADVQLIRDELKLDQRPMALAFTNVTWDTAALGRDTIFKGLLDWIVETVKFFSRNPQRQLVIRCHPSEVRDEGRISADRIEVMLPELIGQLPENVKIVSAHSTISSYVLMDLAQCGLVYTSTAGMEMAALGKPVLVAARTHYARKSFTCDPNSKEDYFFEIDRLLKTKQKLSESESHALYRYAHHFFFERMIPFEPVSLVPKTSVGEISPRNKRRFMQGQLRGLETICDCIANKRPPVYQEVS